MFKNYYYSSGTSVTKFSLNHQNPAPYDTFSLSMISNDNVNFYSTGTPYNRIEKTKIVSEYSPSYKYLNVCVRENNNCCECEKCLRTILGLQALNKLDKYGKVFDLDLIRKNKKENEKFLLEKVKEGIPWYKDIYQLMKQNGQEISLETELLKRKKQYEYLIIEKSEFTHQRYYWI